MSDPVRDRIAELQHKRRQTAAHGVLSAISDKLGEAHHVPVDPSVSLRIQGDLYGKLKAMRASAGLDSATFATAGAAVDELLTRASHLAPEAIYEFYTSARGSGFFTGPLSRAFLMSCLEQGQEGIALVEPTLTSGVLLDVAVDDPARGDFYEVEWW